MTAPNFDTPIAFCIFNRPKQTAQVFEQIANIKPKHLLVIGDGPRTDRIGEAELVRATRNVLNKIDWPCELQTQFSESNMGCGRRMASGISWAFEQFDELIILEDDCLPSPSFFGFCQELLERYRDDVRVSMISGDNFQPRQRSESSYYFSNWPHIWGWASWKRAWEGYDLEIKNWPAIRDSGLLNSVLDSEHQVDHWTETLDRCYRGEIDTWDFAWTLNVWLKHGLTVLPSQNLIKNLGFGEGATHTTDPMSPLAMLTTHELGQLKHPDKIERCVDADNWTFDNIFSPTLPATQPAKPSNWLKRLFQTAKAS